jgi:hypothetical protein
VGVSRPGRHLQLSPTTHLVLFAKGRGAVAAAWDVAGPSDVFLPGPRGTIRDMTGRGVSAADRDTLRVTPSPVFVDLPGRSLLGLPAVQRRSVPQGTTTRLPWAPVWMPKPLVAEGATLRVPVTTPPDRYVVFGKTRGGYEAVGLDVTAPLEIVDAQMAWPASEPAPSLRVTTKSSLRTPVSVTVRAALGDKGKTLETPARIAPGGTATVSFPLPKLEPGRRYRGQVVVTAAALPGIRPTAPIDLTFVPCPILADAAAEPDWAALPSIDISSWGPFGGPRNTPGPIDPQDCSARLQIARGANGMHCRITVRDDTHRQNRRPKDMWCEDSVQISFDMDASLPWQENVGGWNGHHRIFEYGAALRPDGPVTWRWISYREDLPPKTSEPGLIARIRRHGDRTVYDLTFPWAILGLTEAPPRGSTIGFAMVVNDVDTKGHRHGLPLFGGIVANKDFTALGRLWLR